MFVKEKATILITTNPGHSSLIKNMRYNVDKTYAAMIADAGGIPVGVASLRFADEFCEMADALLLTDGIFINPRYYKELYYNKQYETNYYRDTVEFALFDRFYKAGKPILGIGRGMHLINAALGGNLIQNLVEQTGRNHNLDYLHKIETEEGSLVRQVYGTSSFVNSHHEQAVDHLAEGFVATAYSTDGTIEALEHKEKPIWGIQWLPQQMCICGSPEAKETATYELAKAFIEKVSMNKERHYH